MMSEDLRSRGDRFFPEKSLVNITTVPRDMVYLICAGERARLVPKIVPYSTVNDYEAPDDQPDDQAAV